MQKFFMLKSSSVCVCHFPSLKQFGPKNTWAKPANTNTSALYVSAFSNVTLCMLDPIPK